LHFVNYSGHVIFWTNEGPRIGVRELADEGHSNREIADVLGVHESTVREDKDAGKIR
jgi:transposase